MDIIDRSGNLFDTQKELTLLSKTLNIFRGKDSPEKIKNLEDFRSSVSFQKSPHVCCTYFELEYRTHS